MDTKPVETELRSRACSTTVCASLNNRCCGPNTSLPAAWQNRPAEALVAAKRAVALYPENLLAQMALGDAQTALSDKNSARAAYELALAAENRLEADAQPLYVPDLEKKLRP
jgi:hypothetical protein